MKPACAALEAVLARMRPGRPLAVASTLLAHGLEALPARLDGDPVTALNTEAVRKLAGARVRTFRPWRNHPQDTAAMPVVGVVAAPTT